MIHIHIGSILDTHFAMKLEECLCTRWSSRGQNFFLIKGKNLGLSESIEIRKKKGYVATLLKEKRIGVPEEINASHNRISIYLHYSRFGAQPTRTNFERGSLIDGSLYCHSILGISKIFLLIF
ncbi:hypothetical protein ACJX0J_002240 [Zea mays]